jgi:glucose-6-phosphate 1-dehydrogenase
MNTKPEPAVFVIFGITGDLAGRKLLPALYELYKSNLLNEKTAILGTSRREVSVDELLNKVELCVLEENNVCDPEVMTRIKNSLHMVQLDPDTSNEYVKLADKLRALEADYGVCMNRLYYLSVPPEAYSTITHNLGTHKLNESCEHGVANSRLLVEKPFGYDLASAQKLIEDTNASFREEQVFRIDHYLAKETAQNILTFRRHNPVFSSIWNSEHIESIEICAYEKIGIEGRANFYEPIGALRDFVQSHLLQLLALTTLELPEKYDEGPWLHTAKFKLLQSVKAILDDPAQPIIRGQYEGYQDEVKNPNSTTETFVRLPLAIENDRWRGTRISVATGKALVEKRTDVTVCFHDRITNDRNKLVFRIQPNEGISLDLSAKRPGFESQIENVDMDFSYHNAFGSNGHPDAYERVLLDAVKGDRSLFPTSEEVLQSWQILQPVQLAWQESTARPLLYQFGVDPQTIHA